MDNKGHPIYVCRKDEVKNLFDSQFWTYYEAWQYYHTGFGMPHGRSWAEYDPDFINPIMQMEVHFKRNFSLASVTVQYLEAIIRRMGYYAK